MTGSATSSHARHVLLLAYGGGHIEMVLPVMRVLRQRHPDWTLTLIALTTGHAVALRAGEAPLGYRDALHLFDAAEQTEIEAAGRRLLPGNTHPEVDESETVAYLGINYREWVQAAGTEQAERRWHEQGRHGFLPLQFCRKLLTWLQPDLVLSTNSPRSEQAVIEAAQGLGIPSLSMVDLFALPGDPFLRRPVQADRITVLCRATAEHLQAAGYPAERIRITGNPALDAFSAPQASLAGLAWREAQGWPRYRVVLWAGHLEPYYADPQWAGPALGQRVQDALLDWLAVQPEAALIIRYHPNEWQQFTEPLSHPRVFWSRADREPLLPLLAAADQVIVQASTTGVQAAVAGKQVLCLRFSPLVQFSGLDYARLGLADGADDLAAMVRWLDSGSQSDCAAPDSQPALQLLGASAGASAAQAVADQVQALLAEQAGMKRLESVS